MAKKSRPKREARRPAPKRVLKKMRGSAVKRKAPRKRAPSKSAPRMVEAALASFAHEVRTPLTGILAISNLLATSDLPEREKRWVDTIKAGAEHLSSLATLFVDAARSRGTSAGREDLFDLRALARNTGDSLAGRATANGLQCEVEISEKLPALVVGDSVRLRAALENLIDNAVKFTEDGGVALSVKTARGPSGKATVSFAVSDSGIGLSMNEIKKLFRPFSQANVSIASRFGGAGLGLSSVKQLARAMGGDVAVSQRKGGGTTFTLMVTLRLAKEDKATSADAQPLTGSSQSLRLLSVEDNPFGRVVLNAILTELGHQTEFVGQGAVAAERVAQGGFDAVLMDMVLPDISGIEAIRAIRALESPTARIAIIGISGRGEDETEARAAGADAFLLKPVSPRALATALLAASSPSAAAT